MQDFGSLGGGEEKRLVCECVQGVYSGVHICGTIKGGGVSFALGSTEAMSGVGKGLMCIRASCSLR